ncbi:SH3 domain-containing protein [Solidesulfovibrio sp.]|uniref:SH3 domain-containing protein n=1 Tax=Solidesulfovibrio sp. TaxID=2910990 RepID=UPI00261D4BBF|nr:SH3 domain-containing protein [Solidesulfovibrio sp.]
MKAVRGVLLLALFGVAAALSGCVVAAGPAVYYHPAPPPCPEGFYWSPDYGCVALPPAEVVVPPDAVYAVVNTAGLSLRSCPTTQCGIVASLNQGEQVQVLSHEGAWTHVWAFGRGLEGWVASRYLD